MKMVTQCSFVENKGNAQGEDYLSTGRGLLIGTLLPATQPNQ
jgi:hypothetical protein